MSRRPDAAHYDIDQLRGDVCAGLISAVVILPVALAFGVASGLGAAAGLYGAIAAGFFAAVFGGTRCQIPPPTAPTTVAMAVILTSHSSSLAEAMTVVIMGGLLQMLMGLSRIGRFVTYTPYVVVSGFMSDIGIIMIVIQCLPFLGMPAAPGGALGRSGRCRRRWGMSTTMPSPSPPRRWPWHRCGLGAWGDSCRPRWRRWRRARCWGCCG